MNDFIDKIREQHVHQAFEDIDNGIANKFRNSIAYDIVYRSRRYPPKVVIAIAAQYATGKPVSPGSFRGGKDTKAFRQIENLGFAIEPKDENMFPDEIPEEQRTRFPEGAQKTVIVNRYERDAEARRECIRIKGPNCMVCDFNFESFYGDIGEGFIHVHHITPLSEVNDCYEVDPETDLAPVCPNCHAMLHKRRPPYSINELKQILSRRVPENSES